MWFSESNANKIGRITTSGAITEYAVPTSSGQPEGITSGPDGGLWFTEHGSGKIGRMTTAVVVTNEFGLANLGGRTVFTMSGLSNGSHTVKVVKQSSQYMLVDAFKVR